MILSIVIPVYNEEKTIEEILEKVSSIKLSAQIEIICIDDGSSDDSAKIIKRYISKNENIAISYHYKQNGGKGSAIRLGFEKSIGDVITIQDADLEYDPNDYHKLLEQILCGSKVVYGSRYLSEIGHLKENNHITFKIHKFGNWSLSLLTSLLYNARLTDMETCYKMFTREVYNKINLKADKFDIEPEITAKICKAGYKITEVPINYYSRDFSEGKKITWKDGIAAAWCLVKYKFIN